MLSSQPWPAQAAQARRTARIIAAAQGAAMLIGTVLIFYLLGRRSHFHRLGIATTISAAYLVITAASAGFLYRTSKIRAIRWAQTTADQVNPTAA